MRSVREYCHHRPSMRATRPKSLDRLPKLLVDRSHLRRGRRFAVSYAREAEEIAWKLSAVRMEDKGSAHSEGSAEKAGFEDDVVSRRSLGGFGRRRCRWTRARPVVPSEHKSSEVDFMSKFEEPLQCGCPGIEGCRPGFYVRACLQDRVSAPAAVSPAFLTSPGRFEACPYVPSRQKIRAACRASVYTR